MDDLVLIDDAQALQRKADLLMSTAGYTEMNALERAVVDTTILLARTVASIAVRLANR